ncbi:hypothetical protein [Nocardia brasiliensis]|uniref:hypothetical protein n=1 Tax=Nocardia brasiliensis TaxID=37326 RepID=UPI00366DDC59
MSQRIRDFRKEFPDIAVSMITGWTAWNLDLLESGEALRQLTGGSSGMFAPDDGDAANRGEDRYQHDRQ